MKSGTNPLDPLDYPALSFLTFTNGRYNGFIIELLQEVGDIATESGVVVEGSLVEGAGARG